MLIFINKEWSIILYFIIKSVGRRIRSIGIGVLEF